MRTQSSLHRVARAILNQVIRAAGLPPGARLPSVRVLEQQFGTSRTTIVHALSLLEAQGVIVRRQRSGCYVADPCSAGIASVDTGTAVGFAASDLGYRSELVWRCLQGASHAAEQLSAQLIAVDTRGAADGERRALMRLADAGVDGIVLFPSPRPVEAPVDAAWIAVSQRIPLVLLAQPVPGYPGPQVVMDHIGCGMEMAAHLLRAGHRRVACLSLNLPGVGPLLTVERRLAGLQQVLSAAGCAVRKADICTLPSLHPAEVMSLITDALRGWMQQRTPPSAVVAVEDVTAVCAVQAARSLGVAVPQQLLVCGFDGASVASMMDPPIPSTRPDFTAAGALAVRLALSTSPSDRAAVTHTLPEPIYWPDTTGRGPVCSPIQGNHHPDMSMP